MVLVAFFLTTTACNEGLAPTPTPPGTPTLARIETVGPNGNETTSFQYQNGLLTRKSSTNGFVEEYTYNNGVLERTNIDLGNNLVFVRLEHQIIGTKLVTTGYSSVNHQLGNTIAPDGLMLMDRVETYWLNQNEIREDRYTYYLGNATLSSYSVRTIANGNVVRLESFSTPGATTGDIQQWDYFNSIMNPERNEMFGSTDFMTSNMNMIKTWRFNDDQNQPQVVDFNSRRTFQLNNQGYPTSVTDTYTSSGQTQTATSLYFYNN